MASKKKKSVLKDKVLKVSEGVLETAVDLTLYCALWGVDILAVSGDRGKVFVDSDNFDWKQEALEQINYKTIKNAINNARQNGLIKTIGSGNRSLPELTQDGIKKLEEKLPEYNSNRNWDGILHLITYDIPEDRKSTREALRKYIKSIDCGMLQKSVWITPYDPREQLEEFTYNRVLKETIIISSIGKDGTVGDENITSLVSKVYNLKELNNRYKKFLEKYSRKTTNSIGLPFLYHSILKDDPQLPFELLPKDWLGDKAYNKYKQHEELT